VSPTRSWQILKPEFWAKDIQNGDKDAKFFLFLGNLWAQVRNQCFSAKAV
jgi:hypothetical protein